MWDKMEFEKSKYCICCGEKISADAERCGHCGEWVEGSSVSRNHVLNSYVSQDKIDKEENENLKDESVVNSVNSNNSNNINNSINESSATIFSKVLPIRRLFLLTVLTGGLYFYYWFYKNNCFLRDDLGKDVSPFLRTILLLVPIVNFVIIYELLSHMNEYIEAEGIESYSPGLNTLIWIFLPIIGRLWLLINVQESINELWKMRESNLPVRREFSNSEIVVMFLGVIFWISYFCFIFLITFLSIIGALPT
jgi:hypothetical protein